MTKLLLKLEKFGFSGQAEQFVKIKCEGEAILSIK